MRGLLEANDTGKIYALNEAIDVIKKSSGVSTKIDETVSIALHLDIDVKKSDQTVRGVATLPAGTGRSVIVGVVASGAYATAAQEAGADIVGYEDFIEEIAGGKINFDVLIATPDSMRLLAKVGKVLGSKGLMPNPKTNTVTNDVADAVRNAKTGQVQFRADKSGIVHAPVGKVSFSADNLKGNIETLIATIRRLKPQTSKGTYLKRLWVSSTMGLGYQVDLSGYR